jgi:hypothetical protein
MQSVLFAEEDSRVEVVITGGFDENAHHDVDPFTDRFRVDMIIPNFSMTQLTTNGYGQSLIHLVSRYAIIYGMLPPREFERYIEQRLREVIKDLYGPVDVYLSVTVETSEVKRLLSSIRNS